MSSDPFWLAMSVLALPTFELNLQRTIHLSTTRIASHRYWLEPAQLSAYSHCLHNVVCMCAVPAVYVPFLIYAGLGIETWILCTMRDCE